MGERRLVRVLPDVAAVRKTFDYLVPEELSDRVGVGTQVRVMLHNRRVGAWVVAEDVEPPPGVKLQPILSVRGWGPPPSVMELVSWAAWRWAGSEAQLLRTASARGAVRTLGTSGPGRPRGSSHMRSGEAPGRVDASELAQLARECMRQRASVLRMPPAEDPVPLVLDLLRNVELDGETGFLVLAATHVQARHVAAGLRRAGFDVASLPEDWAMARRGGCVAIGTRAAAFAPLPSIAGAVVLDAHDEAYQQEQAPTWIAWSVVVERARRQGAPCVLVSPCPTLDLLACGPLFTFSRSHERNGWPVVETVDRRGDDPRSGLFSSRLVNLLRWATDEPSRRVVCILNRTGRVRLLVCASCNSIARCEKCNGPVELVEDEPRTESDGDADSEGGRRFFRCRRCTAERPVVCSVCGAERFKSLRLGIGRVRQDLEALLSAPVAEISASEASSGPGPGPGETQAQVVVGTEAALHRLASADAVVFLDFDSELMAPRLRAGEEALALIVRAGRLVGAGGSATNPEPPAAPGPFAAPGPVATRGPVAAPGPAGVPAASGRSSRAPGRILVQTLEPSHVVLQAAVRADPGLLSNAEREIREALHLPPMSALARISGAGAEAYATALRDHLDKQAHGELLSVQGPVGSVWILRSTGHGATPVNGATPGDGGSPQVDANHRALCDLLASVSRPPGRLRVEVDPLRA